MLFEKNIQCSFFWPSWPLWPLQNLQCSFFKIELSSITCSFSKAMLIFYHKTKFMAQIIGSFHHHLYIYVSNLNTVKNSFLILCFQRKKTFSDVSLLKSLTYLISENVNMEHELKFDSLNFCLS